MRIRSVDIYLDFIYFLVCICYLVVPLLLHETTAFIISTKNNGKRNQEHAQHHYVARTSRRSHGHYGLRFIGVVANYVSYTVD